MAGHRSSLRAVAVAQCLRKKWQERPIDFWLQLSCFFLFAPSRGYGRLLGVLMALLQWYQCGFMFFMAAKWWYASKGLAYVVVVLVIATSQALTFSITTLYFWQTDFVPFQGCSLPCLVLPESNGKADDNIRYLSDNLEQEDKHVGTLLDNTVREHNEEMSDGRALPIVSHDREKHSSEPRAHSFRPGDGRHSLLNVAGSGRADSNQQAEFDSSGEATPLLQANKAQHSNALLLDASHSQWSHYSTCDDAVVSDRGLVFSQDSLRRTMITDEAVRQRFVHLHGNTCLWAHGLLLLGFGIITTIILIDAGWERFFDGSHIRYFLNEVDCPAYLEGLYFLSVVLIYWGMFCVVTACCLFFCATRSMIVAISEAEKTTVLPCISLEAAIEKQESMMCHVRHLTKSVSLWFIVHNISFIVLIMASAYWWLMSTYKNDKKDKDEVKLYVSVVATCTAISFKFAFPVLAASRVTHQWKKLVRSLNCSKGWSPRRRADQDILVNYITRADSGFVVCGIQVADSIFLVIFILLGSFLGLLRTIHSAQTAKHTQAT